MISDTLDRRGWLLLLVLAGSIFLEGVDVSMFGVALPAIRADLGISTGALQWVLTAYVLGYGGFVLLGGRAADLLGRRRVFLAALGVFLVFSGLGGFAQEGWVLILARFVTGVAAAFMTPAGLSIITTSYAEGAARNQALLIYAGTAAAGFSTGLVAGGLLTSIDWRWVFFAPVVLSALLLVIAPRVIPRAAAAPRTAGFDVAGALLVTAGMVLLVLGVVRAPDVGPGPTVATLAGAALALAAFVLRERAVAAPLVRLGLLRSAALVRANLAALLLTGSFFGFQFLVVLYLQQVRGWSPLETGLALLPVAIDLLLAPTVTPWLVARYGTTRVILGGLLSLAAAFALFLPIGADSTYLAAMLPTMLLIGLAFSFGYGPLTIAATDGVHEDEQGLASGVINSSFQFGSALGVAAVSAVLVAGAGDGVTLGAIQAALVVPVVGAALAVGVTALGLRAAPGGVPAPSEGGAW